QEGQEFSEQDGPSPTSGVHAMGALSTRSRNWVVGPCDTTGSPARPATATYDSIDVYGRLFTGYSDCSDEPLPKTQGEEDSNALEEVEAREEAHTGQTNHPPQRIAARETCACREIRACRKACTRQSGTRGVAPGDLHHMRDDGGTADGQSSAVGRARRCHAWCCG